MTSTVIGSLIYALDFPILKEIPANFLTSTVHTLSSISAPLCEIIGSSAFSRQGQIINIDFPNCIEIR